MQTVIKLLDQTAGEPALQWFLYITLALLNGMRANFVEARAQLAHARSLMEELGLHFNLAMLSWQVAEVEFWASDPVAAEGAAREGVRAIEALDLDNTARYELRTYLAEALYRQGRYEEAEECVQASSVPIAADAWASTLERRVQARLLARKGQFAEAEGLAREALAMTSEEGRGYLHGEMLMTLAEVLELAGRPEEAVPSVEKALDLYERKGHLPAAQRARDVLAGLGAGITRP